MSMKKYRPPHLKRELSFLEVTLSGVGVIFGAGIYVLIGKAAALGGNALWLSFFIGAILASLTGLSYAELSSMYPKAGAEYDYVEHAFGKRLAFFIGWLVIVAGVIGGATVSLGFAGYFSALFGTPIFLAVCGLLFFLMLINLYGIKQSAGFAVVSAIIESLGLILIILIGLPYISSTNLLEMPLGLSGVFSAAALLFFAYIGFEDIVKLSEETKKSVRTIPLALLLSIAISTIIYILVAISAVSILGWESLVASSAPLADAASKALGGNAFFVLSIIALFATSNTVLLFLLATSRIIYGMARDRVLPGLLGELLPNRRTPYVSILLITFFAAIFALSGKIESVANLTNFMLFITFLTINVAVIYLRYKYPVVKRPFRVPLGIGKFPILPAFGIATSFLLLGSLNFSTVIYGILISLTGLLVFELLLRKDI